MEGARELMVMGSKVARMRVCGVRGWCWRRRAMERPDGRFGVRSDNREDT